MSAITFDTLKFVERIEKAGVSLEQAAAFADSQKYSRNIIPISYQSVIIV